MRRLTFLLLGLAAQISYADSATATFSTSAQLTSSCVISAENLEFGDITPTGTAAQWGTATSSISVRCSNKTSYSIYQGWGTNGSETARLLKGATSRATIRYFLCTAPGNSGDQCLSGKLWWPYGFTGSHTNKISDVGDGSEKTHTVYGNILKKYINADNYSDTVTTQIVF